MVLQFNHGKFSPSEVDALLPCAIHVLGVLQNLEL